MNKTEEITDWLTEGCIYLLQKSEETESPINYRPIICLLCRENLSPLLTALCTLGVLLAAEGDLSQRSIDVWELRPP